MTNRLSYYSLTTIPVQALSSTGVVVAAGTAFFYKQDDAFVYLVTNWHVVTAREPDRPQFGKSGAVPITLRYHVHTHLGESAIRRSKITRIDQTINSEDGGKPSWFEHPQYRYGVDVVVLKIDKELLINKVTYNCIGDYKTLEVRYEPEVMDDIFVIGYPWGLTGGSTALPLFKRGSIATDPIVPIRELPHFLIDCRTAKAMSGSPVIARHSGIWTPPGTNTKGRIRSDSVIGTVENFAGVYSGRYLIADADRDQIADSNLDKTSEIGIVWLPSALDEIIQNGVPGTKMRDVVR